MPKKKYKGTRTLKPKTKNQADYIRAMIESDITICDGPAGSGKTSVAVGLACQYLQEGKVDKIVVTRPVVESGKGLGYLPGNLHEKIHPYLIPVVEEMNLYLSREKVKAYKDNNTIEICPLEYMRGRNFHQCFMILDEAQNATYEQMKMFATRMGRQSKCVINGDIDQSDLPINLRGGLEHWCEVLAEVSGVSVIELTFSDIIRNDIIAKILSALE
jgi:phosphate starvation-inducible PhoH-like protein